MCHWARIEHGYRKKSKTDEKVVLEARRMQSRSLVGVHQQARRFSIVPGFANSAGLWQPPQLQNHGCTIETAVRCARKFENDFEDGSKDCVAVVCLGNAGSSGHAEWCAERQPVDATGWRTG
ncbi:hypothetical protein AAL_00305 [Moelleriella libera RCEF 2490]|uniref:Uncharacterized protein n=1 Tax=Moelleriella libera RCEF 2490 TaxID=1081109 RepID=A0A166UQN7_9HYPO|nr:hypothetical protein AAL_00305 [Moelleriella libera RCEF 2490]